MDISVLGGLTVRENGVSITPTAPKPRQVLALLALRADRIVTVPTLTEELWGAEPPRSARATLQTYVLQLREMIGAALERDAEGAAPRSAKDVLVTTPGGYQLNTTGGSHDVREFERLAGLGYRAMDAGDFPGAARQLGGALSLWTGAAFADVRTGAQLSPEVKRLEETRLCALDQRIDADLKLGRHRELLGELSVLVTRHPMHETLHGQFMLALHRSGRRTEALETYQRLRRALIGGLGLEPSAGLRRLQLSLLMAGPETGQDSTPARGEARSVRVG